VKRILLALVALPLAACSVGDKYERPAIQPPAAWATQAAAPAQWPSPDWWQGFRSARLAQLMEDARTANFDVAAAVARVRQADAQLRISGAALLPQVNLNGSGERARSAVVKTSNSTSATTKNPLRNTFEGTLDASYEIDFWGKNAATREAAQASAAATRFDQQTVWLTAQSSVATTYFDILGGAERLRVARENLRNAEDVLAAIRDRVRAGTATSLDQAQQESVVATQRATIAPLEQAMRQNANALAILTGRMPEQMALPAETLDQLSLPAVAPGLPSELLARRPDVQNAEAQLIAANADVTQARAAFFPSITLTAQTGFQSAELATLFLHQGWLWNVASAVAQPIFSGGRLEGQVELNEAKRDELVQTYRKAVFQAFADVENALIAVQKTAEEEDAQRAAEATSRNAFNIAQDQFRGGIVDITTVLNTQRTLFTVEDTLAQARINHLQAIVGLYKALGGGWSS
jgi:NodT family efflux transporter outer membrane factor (OMF) lipoprotein